jgi:hypothetical protein
MKIGGTVRWRRALVTGASSGIGRAIAERLAADGVELVVVARRTHLLEEFARRAGPPVEVLAADLSAPEDQARVARRLAAPEAPIDLLVNCAGGGRAGPLIARPAEDRVAEAELNGLSVLRLCHAAAAAMVPRGQGTILTVASGLGYYPFPGAAVYSASKAFVLSLSASLRYELRGTGVDVTVVSPGPTRTDGAERAGVHLAGRLPAFLIAGPERVADVALAAAGEGRAVEQVTGWNAVLTAGRILPARLSQPILARLYRRFTAGGGPTPS